MNSFLGNSNIFFNSANRSQFAFRVQGVPDETFSVKSFTGQEHALSEDYLFQVVLQAEVPLDPGHCVGRSAVLELDWGGEPVFVHGVVSEFSLAGALPGGGYEYLANLASPLFPLKPSRSNRVFLNKSTPQIIDEVLLGVGMPAAGFAQSLKGTYRQREYTVQYDESDYDFLRRLIDAEGIFFRFESSRECAKVIFHDSVEALPSLRGGGELLYQEQTGAVRSLETIFAFRPRARLLAGEVNLRDYNYRRPAEILDAHGGSDARGKGAEDRHGENVKSMEEGERIARIRQQANDWQRETFVAESDCRGVAPGKKITLCGYPEPACNGEYLIIEVEHQGDQGTGFAFGGQAKGMSYRNKMLLIRAGIPFRRPLPAPRRVHGTFTARIESSGGEYAHLDEQGRYRVRVDFDRAHTPAAEASHPVRLLQPYGGNNYGWHHPLHAGTEVALSCINGDLDRPVILGVLSNPDTPATVNSSNPSQNILRTRGGNELLLDDRKGGEKVELFTKERKNILSLDAHGEGHLLRLATEEGEMEVLAGKTLLIESGDTQTLEAGNDHLVTVEKAQRLLTRKGSIEAKAATDLRMRAGEHILMQAETANLEMSAGADLQAEVGDSLSAAVNGENLEILVGQGEISMQAAGAITVAGQGGGTLHIGQGSGAIEISSGGDLALEAPKLQINATTITIKGGSMGNN
ncbi:hypothetical protein DESUT3_00960 [Desulfuromonas versatilis]|uniref:Gp5/Type VI secretion system Vgr protein OB-fold domain-containing protein n=1 Tax=Desulfuromonas versatilis TaxID=2802975 RepID=A0ABM8HR19_9BACT|nr:type VI secretion system tip protein TssI/VgrG [Desulfuromonas versatilis]BCR03027.1 hypothetical protein DESUT3_00960 [Desulfuromonas versatilis]